MKRTINRLTTGLALLLALALAPALLAESPVGRWKTIDDETGKVKSIVNIYEAQGVLYGNIEKLLDPADQGKNCDKCPAPQTNKPVEGLMIIWGMKPDGAGYGGGSIMDPKNGKVYSCNMKVEGNKLIVRGFIGFSVIGRSQTWLRM